MSSPDPAGARRAAAIEDHRLLGGGRDPELDAVVRVAAWVAGVPTAVVNLVDDRSQHQVATVGFEGSTSACEESMCARVITLGGGLVHVSDATTDPRFADRPFLDEGGDAVRFYAAHPIATAEGVVIGTLCVFDTRTGALDEAQRDRLADLATVVSALFERRRQAARQGHLVAAAEEARDLVELAHAELGLRLDELERSNGELEQLAAVASHDLRSPLTVVDGYLELLEDLHEADEGPAPSWVATARGGVRRMTALIEALLRYAQTGAGTVRVEPVDVRDVLALVRADLAAQITAAGADLVVEGALPVVSADRVQLQQVLSNLVSNSVKFARPGVPVTVRCSASEQDDAWVLSVRDDGRGIPAEQRASVFGMFERVGTGHAVPGHGIGLATCERIVGRHGGRIWAEETPGGGTTVRLTLPRRPGTGLAGLAATTGVPAPRSAAGAALGADARAGGAPVAQLPGDLVAQQVDDGSRGQ